VGSITAASFAAVIDTPERFKGAHQVEAYLGLVPRELSSGEKQRKGRITKTGDRRTRCLLVEAAWALLRTRRPAVAPLRAWTERLAARRGRRVAVVALARKLAGILYAMMRAGSQVWVRRARANSWPHQDGRCVDGAAHPPESPPCAGDPQVAIRARTED
jgi:transposase